MVTRKFGPGKFGPGKLGPGKFGPGTFYAIKLEIFAATWRPMIPALDRPSIESRTNFLAPPGQSLDNNTAVLNAEEINNLPLAHPDAECVAFRANRRSKTKTNRTKTRRFATLPAAERDQAATVDVLARIH